MGKYEPLRMYLSGEPADVRVIKRAFDDIERVIGASLPASARSGDPRFWLNGKSSRHAHERAWRDAGFRVTEVDHGGGVVTFERV
jgi:hypothetical protein